MDKLKKVMKTNIIEPGIGIGEIKFGLTEDELMSILGAPTRSEHCEYIEGRGDWYKDLIYEKINLGFTFDKEDNYRLGNINVAGFGYYLFGDDLFGESIDFVKKLCKKVTGKPLIYEDYTIDEGYPYECLDCGELEMLFWFDCGKLSELQFSYFFEEDGNTVIWPE